MKYVFLLFMLGCGFHTLTYGVHLWKKEDNKLGGTAVISLAVLGTLIPAFIMFTRA